MLMEAVVWDDSPLATYLEGQATEDNDSNNPEQDKDASSRLSSAFAPRGWPRVRAKFRRKLPPPLQLAIPQSTAVDTIRKSCSRALTSELGRADNARFLERFRYTIVASQLLNTHAYLGHGAYGQPREPHSASLDVLQLHVLTLRGAVITACSAFALAWLINWVRVGIAGGSTVSARTRISILLVVLSFALSGGYAHIRRQSLQSIRQQTLTVLSGFVVTAQELDTAVTGAMSLIQEVELVSRGYRISSPLPPISRLEDRVQVRRCRRLRKHLRHCFSELIPRYCQAYHAVQPLAEEMNLEKYYDIYDVAETDVVDSLLGYSDEEFEDCESVRTLKLLAARYHTIRRVFLCCLMALEANGGGSDLAPWSTAAHELRGASMATELALGRLSRVLTEEETFPIPGTPRLPLTPGRERWRAQMRKLNSLSSGIRGLQAKLHVLREESDQHLDESHEVAELGTNLMIQYESIGVDLKALMQEWEDGKAALASNIDRNERRISSMSGLLSPSSSLSGTTAVEEGGALEALSALNGDRPSRSSMEFSSSDAEEVFEAISIPRQRSLLTREERVAKMKDDRIKRDSVKANSEASTKMLRELESVINMRPRSKVAPGGRVTSI